MASISDFQIIGGGINGLLLARELADAGAKVQLVEKGGFGKESSWAGGGIVSPLYPWRYGKAITALASWAQSFYPKLVNSLLSETGIDAELCSTGLMMLDADDKASALAWANENNRLMKELDAEEILQQEGRLAESYRHALWMPEVANVRNPRLLQALLASLEAHSGVELLSDTTVNALQCSGKRVSSLILSGAVGSESHELKVGQLVICAGAWSSELLQGLQPKIDVHPVKGQMLLYKFAQPPVNSIVLTAGRYLIPRKDGYVLAGSTLEYEQFDKAATLDARASLHESAVNLLPELAHCEPVAQWAGLRPGSGDGIPYIGAVPEFENLFMNAGQFRNGLVLAPASACLMAT